MFGRLRKFKSQRGDYRTVVSKSARWPTYGWIGACLALVAVLGTLQFGWIGEVSESQQQALRSRLEIRMQGALHLFQREFQLLLSLFGPDVDFDPRGRLESYSQSYLSWHAVSTYGPVVKRVLFYDCVSPEAGNISELLIKPRGIKPVALDHDLALARTHIDENGFRPGSRIGLRWTDTWMFLARAMVMYRPITRLETDGQVGYRNESMAGYLILQLDLDFIRDKLIPNLLRQNLMLLNRDHRFYMGIKVDGKNLFVYEPTGSLDSGTDVVPRADFAYKSRSPGWWRRSPWSGTADATVALPLIDDGASRIASEFGAVQRIGLWGLRQAARMESLPRTLPDFGPNEGMNVTSSRDVYVLPRLFLVDDEPHMGTFWGRHEGISDREAVNLAYSRSVTMGIVVLLVLVGVMAMAAKSERQAARMATLRIGAAVFQSHQLRTPLTGISVLADNMVQGMLGSGKKIIAYGEDIREFAGQLNEIVDRTARLAAVDSTARPFRLAMLDVSEVARDAFETVRSVVEGAGFSAECALAEDLPEVQADSEALRQCLLDLLDNAVKYGLPGRWVKIETDELGSGRGRQVRIRVHDRGQGIPADEMQAILEPFHRGREVAGSSIAGSGLGLALVRRTIEGMGAKLSLESEVGRGSVFAIHFPVA